MSTAKSGNFSSSMKKVTKAKAKKATKAKKTEKTRPKEEKGKAKKKVLVEKPVKQTGRGRAKNDATIANLQAAEEFLFASQPVLELRFPDVEYAFPHQDQEVSSPSRLLQQRASTSPSRVGQRASSPTRFMPISAFQRSTGIKSLAKTPLASDPSTWFAPDNCDAGISAGRPGPRSKKHKIRMARALARHNNRIGSAAAGSDNQFTDFNPRNFKVLNVFYKTNDEIFQGAVWRDEQVLSSGGGCAELDVAMPPSWSLCDVATTRTTSCCDAHSDATSCDAALSTNFPNILKFSGHVKFLSEMEDVIRQRLEPQKSEGLCHYAITTTLAPKQLKCHDYDCEMCHSSSMHVVTDNVSTCSESPSTEDTVAMEESMEDHVDNDSVGNYGDCGVGGIGRETKRLEYLQDLRDLLLQLD